MMRVTLLLAVGPLIVFSSAGHAQRLRGPGGLKLEGRMEVVAARDATYEVGPGVSYPLSSYARGALSVTGGLPIGEVSAEEVGGEEDVPNGIGRAEGVVRFLLDPFKERERGFYAGAGVGVRWVADTPGTAYLLLLVGLEGEVARVPAAVELGVGDGARVALVLRQPRRGYR